MNFKTKLVGLATAFALVVGVSASSAAAMSTSELLNLLVSLGIISADQVAVVNAAVGGTGTTGSSDCAALKAASDMTLESQGANVTMLQNWLIAGGYSIPAGATGYFGAQTQNALAQYQVAMGITPAAGYFGPTTKASIVCAPVVTVPTTPGTVSGLQGGAGDITVAQKTSGTETTVKEGNEEKVLHLEIEADDNSDIAITSVRVLAGVVGTGSTRLNRYVDEVIIYQGNTEVGSADASDFSRSGATSTATIALKNAVIDGGSKESFYVAFVAKDSIDSADRTGSSINVTVNRIRFEDATGAIMTENPTASVNVDFEASTVNDGARVLSSSNSPESAILKVKENSNSDDYHVFSFRLKGDTDSSDVWVTELPIAVSIVNATTGAILTEDLINDMYVKMGNRTYNDYSFANLSIAGSATEVATSTFEIDEGDLEIMAGDTSELKVYVQFGKQSGKYYDGTKVTLSVAGASIVAENPNGDSVTLSGISTGKQQTVSLSAAEFKNVGWPTPVSGSAFLDFFFTVDADDEAFDVLTASVASSTAGTATTSAGVLTKVSGDADSIAGGFAVQAGDTASFRIRYSISGVNGTWSEVTITSVAGKSIDNDKQLSPTLTLNLN